jgi:hypothetical protein
MEIGIHTFVAALGLPMALGIIGGAPECPG